MAKRRNDRRGLEDEKEDDRDVRSEEYWRSSIFVPAPAVAAEVAPTSRENQSDDTDSRIAAKESRWGIRGPETIEAGTPGLFEIYRHGGEIQPGEYESVRVGGSISGDATLDRMILQQIAEQLSGFSPPPGISLERNRLVFSEDAADTFAFMIVVRDDPAQSGDGLLQMSIAAPSSGRIVEDRVETTVVGGETAPPDGASILTVANAAPVAEGDGDGAPSVMTFVVDRTGEGDFADHEVTFDFETYMRDLSIPLPPGTPGQDYQATSGTLTFAANVTRVEIEVQIVGDNQIETNELIDIRISNLQGPDGSQIADGTAHGIIVNDDQQDFAPSLYSVIDAAPVVEGDTGVPGDKLVFTIVRDGTGNFADAAGAVDFNTFSDLFGSAPPASPGVDYIATAGTLVFAAGQTAHTVTVDVIGDNLTEQDEVVSLALGNPSGPVGTRVVDSEAEGLILDDETVGASLISISDATPVEEGNPGDTTNLIFAVSRDGIGDYADAAASVHYETWYNFFPDGTPAAPNSDYVSTSGTFDFAAGQTVGWITVAVIEDSVSENNEIVSLRIEDATGAANTTIVDGEAQGLILDDDSGVTPASHFAISNPVPLDEGDPGSAGLMTFVVTRDGDGNYANAAATVNYRTILSAPSGGLGSTVAGDDYIATSGVLEFAPTETAKTVTVQLVGDLVYEQDELLTVELHNASGPPGTSIQDSLGVGRVNDDDFDQVSASHFRISDAAPTLENDPGEGWESLTFEVTRTGSGNFADAAATLQVETVGRFIPFEIPPATLGIDFVDSGGAFTFAAGITQRTFHVYILPDQLEEDNEGVAVRLLSVSGANGSTITDDEGVGIIIDDDTPVTTPSIFSITNAGSVSEGDPGDAPRYMVFEVLRTGEGSAIAAEATVEFTNFQPFPTPANTASGGEDFIFTSGTLTFAPSETSQLVSVQILPDELTEGNETVYLKLENPQGPAGAEISGSGQASGTISDDEPPGSPSTFSVMDATSVVEGDPGDEAHFLVFDVVRTGSGNFANTTTSVQFEDYYDFFGDYTPASANGDYVATAGTLVFGEGETLKQVTVDLMPDLAVEPDEAITIQISNPSGPPGTAIGDNQGVGLILNDDFQPNSAPPVALGDVLDTAGALFEDEAGSSAPTFGTAHMEDTGLSRLLDEITAGGNDVI